MWEAVKKTMMLFEKKIMNFFMSKMGTQRLEMVECVVNGRQEGITGGA
jgi:hypothetical protein